MWLLPDYTLPAAWHRWLWIALGCFATACLAYVGMLFVPTGAWLGYGSSFMLHTHLFAYAQYETPFSTHELPLDYYTIAAYYKGAWPVFVQGLFYVPLCLWAALLCVWLALSTYLKRYWFWISQGMFAAMLYSCNIPQLRLWGRVDQLPYLGLLLPFVLAAWQIMQRGGHISFSRRVLMFAVWCVLAALGIYYLAAEKEPFLILSHQLYYAQLCITVLFCFLVGHEIPYLFLRLSSGAGFGQSGWQFMVIFLLYLAHLVVFFLRNTGYLTWDLYSVDEFAFLALSACVGLWGLRARAHQYEYLLPAPMLQLNYLLWGAFALFSIVYMRLAGNDPATEVFEDGILFGHLGFGVGFFAYVLMNFHQPLFRNMAVWRVVYEDADTPFMVVRLAGVIIVFGCYILSEKVTYQHAVAGEHMQSAALSILQQQPALAQHHYERAALYGYRSHGANYALGQYAVWRNDYYEAASYYRMAIAKHPSPQAYLELGGAYMALQLSAEAAAAWRAGLARFPTNPYLANNLLCHHILNAQWDSVAYYAPMTQGRAQINIAAAAALQDSSHLLLRPSLAQPASAATLAEHTNYLAALLRARAPVDLPLDTTRYAHTDTHTYTHAYTHGPAYAHNYVLALLRHNPAQARDSLTQYLSHTRPYALQHDMLRLEAFAAQALGHTDKALRLLSRLGDTRGRYGGFYAYVSGLWAYAAGGYSRAAAYFLESYAQGYDPALEIGLQATAMLPASPLREEQLTEWRELDTDTTLWQQHVIENSFLWLEQSLPIDSLLARLETDPSAAPRLGLSFVQRLLDEGKVLRATALLDVLTDTYAPAAVDGSLYAYWALLRAECLLATGDTVLAADAWQTLPQDLPHLRYLHYVAASRAEDHNTRTAQELVTLVREYPFQQQLILHTAATLQQDGYPLQAYTLLLSAIETNPYAPALQQAYVFQALRLGQERYAQAALPDIERLLSPVAYAAYMQKYRNFKEALRVAEEDW